MYLKYWGLAKHPFENVPDTNFMYYSSEHNEALARLLYAVNGNKGIALITGEVGCGKTLLSRVFIQQLDDAKYDIGLMTNPKLEPMDFLIDVLRNFGLHPSADQTKSSLLNLLNEKLLDNYRNDVTTVLIIDESQLISKEVFEEIRLLLNFQLNNRFLMTIILLGQPELNLIIKEMAQLDQRIAIRYHLNPFNLRETAEYISFRLTKAGSKTGTINDGALREIYSYSRGIPRLINNICDMALMGGFIAKAKAFDSDIVKNALQDTSR